jgi:putative ABC transport system permease protein
MKKRDMEGKLSHHHQMTTRFAWLDFKLGVRMLIKYPGLTLVGVLGMAVAIAISAGSFAFFYSYMTPTLPLAEGERVVAIENRDAAASRREDRTLHDFVTWRDELQSIEDVGAYREIARNVVTTEGGSDRVRVAEMTASGFRLARVAPLLGRPLVDADERKGAPSVVVIGYDAWRTHFASDPAVLGKTARLGNASHTIVGVMPEGFAFPVYHGFWVPLQADPLDYERRQGPAINVFGRLAADVSREAAQAELTTIGLRAAAAFPKTNERLVPRLAPYTSLWFGDDLVAWHLHLMQVLITMLLVVVCVNVASLVYARTASREGEIAIRSALGGSRRRIVAQLFVEALMLSTVAAAVGLVLADRVLAYSTAFMEQMDGAPFWMGDGLSSASVVYVAGLAVLGAAIVGAVPALKATGRRLEPGLRQLGGGRGMRLGRTWTALIVFQVAIAVAVMPAAFSMGWQAIGYRTFDPGFAADEFLTARLAMDRDTPPSAKAAEYQREFAARFGDRVADVVRQLEAEPGVVDVTFASRLPGEEPTARIEVEGETGGSKPGHAVRVGSVGIDFFEAFQIPILAGRRFSTADLDTAPRRSVGARRVPTISGRIGEAVGSSNTAGPLSVADSTRSS